MIEIRKAERPDSKIWCHICKAKDGFQVMYEITGFREYGGWTIICKTCAEDLGLLNRAMTPKEYQEAANRTACNHDKALERMGGPEVCEEQTEFPSLVPIKLMHACLGITKEGGELLSLMEKWIYYQQKIDEGKFKDELGDVLWYSALLCNTLQIDMGEVMEANIRKLKTRYPEKYSDEKAANRDREAEMAAVVDKMRGDPIADAMSRKAMEITEQQILRGRMVDAEGALDKRIVDDKGMYEETYEKQILGGQSKTATISIPSAVHPSHEWKQEGRAVFCVLCGKYRGFPPVEMSVSGFEFYPCTRSEEGKSELCCECGGPYPRSDLLRGETYCKKCREEEKVRETKMKEVRKAAQLPQQSAVDSVREKRTRADVLRARNTIHGCCNRHVDNQACDCLETALVGSDVMSAISPEGKCSHCNGVGEVSDEWSTDQTPCPTCNGSGIMSKTNREGAD